MSECLWCCLYESGSNQDSKTAGVYLKQKGAEAELGYPVDRDRRAKQRTQRFMSDTTSPGWRAREKVLSLGPRAWGRLAKVKPQQIFGQELELQWVHSCGGDMTQQGQGEKNPGFSLLLTPSLLPVLPLGHAQSTTKRKPSGPAPWNTGWSGRGAWREGGGGRAQPLHTTLSLFAHAF